MPPKPCHLCGHRLSQHGMAGYCRYCARQSGLLPPDARLKDATPTTTPNRYFRMVVKSRPPNPPVPVVQSPIETRRTITVQGCEYEVVFDGRGPLPGSSSETPRGLGSSLLDSSRVMK